MKRYNRFQHCGLTFYTGLPIKNIECAECGEKIQFDDIIETKEAIATKQDFDIEKTYQSHEEIPDESR